MVETQGLASHMSLTDAATSPFLNLTKPNSPENEREDNRLQTLPNQKKPFGKGLSNMGLNILFDSLDTNY